MNALYGIRVSDFYNLCLRVFEEIRFPSRFSNFSKKMYGNFVHTFLLVYREKLNVSYRRFVQIADENNLQRMLCIKKMPHYTTLQKFMQRIDKKVFEKMVKACCKLIKLKDVEASIDGTGFSNTNPSHHYIKRINGVNVKNYTKTVFLTDNKSKLILNIKTHSDNTHETKNFIPLIKELKKTLKTILADKAYDSIKNREYCYKNNMEVHIPFRQYTQSRKQITGKPSKRKTHQKLFNKQKYKNRALIESINSAIKRTLGSYVNSKKAINQQKQVTLKALAYNIEHITRTIKLLFYINIKGFLQRIYKRNI